MAAQLDLFTADTRFVLVLASMFSDLRVAKMGIGPFGVLVFLRCAGGYGDGKESVSTVGYREIAAQCGLHRNTVQRYVSLLEKEGYLEKKQEYDGGRFTYRLTDKLSFYPNDGVKRRDKEPAGELEIAFHPRFVGSHLEKVKNFLRDGNEKELSGSPIQVTFNVTLVNSQAIGENSSASVVINQENGTREERKSINLTSLPPEAQRFFAQMLSGSFSNTEDN